MEMPCERAGTARIMEMRRSHRRCLVKEQGRLGLWNWGGKEVETARIIYVGVVKGRDLQDKAKRGLQRVWT